MCIESMYGVSAFTSQEQLDRYLRQRCAELTFRTAMTVTQYKGPKPAEVADLYDAKAVFAETATILKLN